MSNTSATDANADITEVPNYLSVQRLPLWALNETSRSLKHLRTGKAASPGKLKRPPEVIVLPNRKLL